MGFLSPWFLGGAGLLGLPLYLHLLRRHNVDQHPFSSLMFFERRTPRSIRHRRLRYLALLALRLALLLLLVVAFANPFINRPAAGSSADNLMLVVIDNSFSMRAGSGLAEARRQVLSVLASRPPSQSAQVLTLGSQIRALTQPTQDPDTLRTAVESVQVGDSRASFGELAHAVRSMAETVRTPITLHLFSDMQRSGMPGNFMEMALPANVTLVPHAICDSGVRNWTVESVDVPAQVWEPKKTRVHAVIAGYHTPAAARTVSLVANGKIIASRRVEVPAGGRVSVEFSALDVPYGFSRCEVRIDSADFFPEDDVSRFAVQRTDPEKVLFLHEANDSRSPLYFRAALSSSDDTAFKLESMTPGQAVRVHPSAYALVVLSDVVSMPRSLEDALLNYVHNGGSVLVSAGTSAAHAPELPVFGSRIMESRYYSRRREGFLTVGQTDDSHPVMEKADRWSGVRFYFAVSVATGDCHVVARLTDQTPLLLEKKIGRGRALLLTSGLDNLTNDFPLHPVFVPFIEQTALYLSNRERRSGARLVDSFYELRSGGQPFARIQVTDPEGRKPLSLTEAATARSFQLKRAGFYEFRLADGSEDVVGVNPDRRESDLSVIPDDVLRLWSGTAKPGRVTGGEARTEQRKPHSLWRYVIFAVLVAAIAESWVATRYLGGLREQA